MTLQNLGKILHKYESELGFTTLPNQLESLKGLPFYNFQNPRDTKTFNDAISLPQKNGQEYPLFDYEGLLFNTLQNHKYVWIKKATGLGITEFMLRYMAWLCLKGDRLSNSSMCIVTGPRIELAITLIDRMKRLFSKLNCQFDSKETVIELNGVHTDIYNGRRRTLGRS